MKIIQLLSGGMDSVSLLLFLRAFGHKVKTISIHYGQRHKRELECAAQISTRLGVEHTVIDLSVLKPILSKSSLTSDQPVPEGHYAAENMKQTVVPNRNMILLSIAGAYCINEGFEEVAYGAHIGDHTIYPDCRKEFIDKMVEAFALCDWKHVSLYSPFWNLTKGEVLKRGLESCDKLDLNYELVYKESHSCYNGTEIACGRCGACTERLQAFDFCKVEDPVQYTDREFWKQATK